MQSRLPAKHVTRRKAGMWIADPALKTVSRRAPNRVRTPHNARASHSTPPLSGAATSARHAKTSLVKVGQQQSDSNHEHSFWFRTTVTSKLFHHHRRFSVVTQFCFTHTHSSTVLWFLMSFTDFRSVFFHVLCTLVYCTCAIWLSWFLLLIFIWYCVNFFLLYVIVIYVHPPVIWFM